MTTGNTVQRRRGRIAVRVGATALLISAVSFIGMPAAEASVDPVTDAGTVAAAMVASGTSITGASWHHTPSSPPATPNGVADSGLGDFPTQGPTFAILTTGDVNQADNTGGGANFGMALGDGTTDGGNSAFDVTILKINFEVGEQMNCIRFDFRFFTEEYPEYVGADYNDAFIAELDGTSWSATGTTVNPGGNFAFDGAGNPITVNTATMGDASGSGTIYDGATAVLTASKKVTTPGAHSLYLSIFDQGADPDTGANLYDSAVFLDNFIIGYTPNPETQCMSGARPKVFSLQLTPATASKTVGSEHTVTATLEELTPDLAVSDGKILFTTSGANSASGSVMTNSSGSATFAYTGTAAGLDAIAACYDSDKNNACNQGGGDVMASVVANWVAGQGGPGGGDDLPTTGRSTGLIAGGGALVLLLGVAGYVLIRRRRVRFVAE